MKTEKNIAEENLKYYNKSFKNGLMSDLGIYQKELCQTHKKSCERFLGYLIRGRRTATKSTGQVIIWDENKEEDLQQAIKLYKEVGI